jgi:cytochrome P450
MELVRPPGPRNLPLVGAALLFQKAPLQRFHGLLRQYGDIVYYRVGTRDLYLIGHPDDIQSVLVGDHQAYMKDELTHELSYFIGRGLVTSEGNFWKRQRKLAAPKFQRRHIERFADTFVARTLVLLDDLDAGPRDVHVDMMELALDIVLHTLFGAATVPDKAAVGRIVEGLMTEFQQVALSWRRLLPGFMNRDSMARLDEGRQALDEIIYGIIRERRDRDHDGDELLGRLLAATDDEGAQMTDVQLRDEVATLFLAGHETTALALSYALLLVARHPHVQLRLREEVDRVLGSRNGTMADVAQLRFTDAVVRESMRLYPPVYAIGREALEDCEIGGFVVPRGAQVLIPQFAVHRDPRWFAEPETFLPERWLDGLAERLPRFAYFPFGGGARVCVGNHFAMLEAVLVLATLVQHLELRAEPDFRVELSPSVTLRPRGGVRLNVERRSSLRVA